MPGDGDGGGGGGGVGGILFDSSVLIAADPCYEEEDRENVKLHLSPGAEYILRKLSYSKIPTGIAYATNVSNYEVNFLERIAKEYSFNCFILDPSNIDETLSQVGLSWGSNGGRFLYVNSNPKEDVFNKLSNCGWLIINLGGHASENSSMISIDKLQELPLIICHSNRKAGDKDSTVVGYIMKPSREEDFAKRGAFPFHPTHNGLIFMPITYELPISSQLQHVDVVLHKATDDIVSITLNGSSELSCDITYTRGMQELQRNIVHKRSCCIIDPFDNIYHILDRHKIQQVLLGLETLKKEGCGKIRGPHFLKVDDFNDPNITQKLLEANLSLPTIVKPRVACGVADAHSMAVVFRDDDYAGLKVPLPAVVQEYVDHSATIFKFYVLGEKVFYAMRKSMPNFKTLMKLSEKEGSKPLYFDSLKSLPTSESKQHVGDKLQIDLELVTDAAGWLRKILDLTIFGFDVVIQEGTRDHVIVDVNYLPSFKEVPDDVAIPAFWEAIKWKFELRNSKEITTLS